MRCRRRSGRLSSIQLSDYDEAASYQLRDIGATPDGFEIVALEHLPQTDTLTIEWTSTSNSRYQIQFTQSPETEIWETVEDTITAESEITRVDLPATPGVTRFYRVIQIE